VAQLEGEAVVLFQWIYDERSRGGRNVQLLGQSGVVPPRLAGGLAVTETVREMAGGSIGGAGRA